jgi:hypothetical protein
MQQCSISGEHWRKHYYYDHDSKRCVLFWYDGCKGTSRNIYADRSTCEQMCEVTNMLTRARKTAFSFVVKTDSFLGVCWDPFDVNYRNQCSTGDTPTLFDCLYYWMHLGHWSQRYYFDHATLTCRLFWYDQCKGNSRNIFDDRITCQWLCEEQPMYNSSKSADIILYSCS